MTEELLEDRLQELLASWEQFYHQGVSKSADELCAGCPELAEEMRRQIEILEKMGHFLDEQGPGLESNDDCDPAKSRAIATSRFMNLRFHARGGMGVVFQAHDAELQRDVALKFLPNPRANNTASRRFRREATITARLEHPGIVPIHGMGEGEDGCLCYSMRFVPGRTLRDAIEEFHSSDQPDRDPIERNRALRALLYRFKSACSTVAFAHSRRILHCDLKPRNIMVGDFEETLVVDWGSAWDLGLGAPAEESILDPSQARSDTEFSSGTPGFMSPEYQDGRRDEVRPMSDVYSLGATLYHLLAGCPPFEECSAVEMTERVRRGTFPSPRQVKPAVPVALEAVCVKAMALAPSDRYKSVGALTEDIERWLADEPVSVLPQSSVDRIMRWVRRHRSATIAAVLVLSTITIAAVSTAVVVSLARRGEHRALMQAESRADLAVEAVRQFREAVTNNLDVQNRPDLAELRKKLLGEPLKFFEQLRADLQKSRDTSYSTTFKLARANHELASLLNEIDSKPNAVRAYREAIALLVPLAAVRPAKRDRDIHDAESVLAESLGQLGLLQRDLGNVDEARASLRKALDIRSRRAQETSAPRDITIHAGALDRLALIETPDSSGVAITLLEEAVNLLRPIAADGVVPADRDLLALIGMHLGTALKAQRRLPEAAERFQESISTLEVLVRSSPENEAFRDNLAAASFNLANLQFHIPNGGSPRAGVERARDLWEELVREFPSANRYQDSLVVTYGTLGILHQHGGRFDEATAAFTRAREIGENLVRDHPAVIAYRTNLGKTYMNLSDLARKAGRTGETMALLGPARDSLRKVFKSRPGDPDARADLAKACGDLARGLLELGRHEEALGAFRECADLELQLLGMNDPRLGPNWARIKTGLLGIARCCLQMGQVSEAAEAAEQLNSLCTDDSACRVEIARELALCSMNAKDATAARRYADRAMDVLKQAGRVGPRDLAALRTDTAFDAIRSHADFDNFLADTCFPADPFTR